MDGANKPTQKLSAVKQAFLALEEAEGKLAAIERERSEPIAIIGIGCRFPGGADSALSFWKNLRNGVSAITEVPRDRWDIDAYYDSNPEAPGKMATRWGAFIDGVDCFDADFFGITPREARSMDPQQRILMEIAWEALADAGHADLEELEGSETGVYVGIASDDYAQMQMAAKGLEGIDTYYASGAARSIASGRLAYHFGFHGPAVSIDTACSSSLLAVHQACRSLKDGECHMALAAGVNLMLAPANTVALTKYQMMAPDGRCKAFDAAADGFVRGEGCGVVVLKRLKEALADQDHIYALIVGSAANQDGPSSGLTAPNGPAQEAVIRAALKRARIQPGQVDYIEAHGTGTALGDPIEVRALGNCFSAGREPQRPLMIGSVKTNIGHLEAASGIAGLIKAALVLHHREIPPSLHFRQPNPNIEWQAYPIQVAVQAVPLRNAGEPHHVGVTALGFSGTNVHVVLSGAPMAAPAAERVERPLHVATLSARSSAGLGASAAALSRHVAASPDTRPGDIGFTLAMGRTHERHRLAVVFGANDELKQALDAFAEGTPGAAPSAQIAEGGAEPKLAFIFTGQGAQFPGMGRALYDHHPLFRERIDQCDELLRPMLGRSIRDVLYPRQPADEALIHQTLYTQPALFALEYALAQLWLAWGVRPAWVLGHSLGEYTAACVAGAVTLPDALKMVAVRAQAMQSSEAGGQMWAIMAPEEQVAELLSGQARAVSIAAVNGPRQVVISGRADAVQPLVGMLRAQNVAVTQLNVSHAFHSPMMEPVLDGFEAAIAGIQFKPPRLTLISNVSGAPAGLDEIGRPDYWRRHMRSPVRFMDGMRSLAGQGCRLFVEIGPQPVLSGMAKAFLDDAGLLWMPSLERRGNDWRCLLSALAQLHLAGVSVDWQGFDASYQRRRVSLPGVSLERRRFWFSASATAAPAGPQGAGEPFVERDRHPLLSRRIDSAAGRVSFRAALGTAASAFFSDHRVAGGASLPMAAVIEAAGAGMRRISGHGGAVKLANVRMDRAIEIADPPGGELEWAFDPDDGGGFRFRLFSRDGHGPWILNAEGTALEADQPAAGEALTAIQGRCGRTVASEAFYRGFVDVGLDFGPAFKSVQHVRVGGNEAIGRLRGDGADTSGFELSPLLIDGALQIIAAVTMGAEPHERPRLFLPVGVDEVWLAASAGAGCWGHAVLREPLTAQTRAMTCDVRLLDDEGRLTAMLHGCRLLAVEADALAAHKSSEDRLLYEVRWLARPERAAVPGPRPAPEEFAPDLAATAAELRRDLAPLAERHRLADYDRELAHIDLLVSRYIQNALVQLGWRNNPSQPLTCTGLAAQLNVAERHHRLLQRFLDILVEDGVVTRTADGQMVASGLGAKTGAPTPRPDEFGMALAAIEGNLVQRCGSRLAEALRGQVDVLDLMYQGDALDVVIRLYTESVTARVYNHLVEACVGRALRAWPRPRKLRVLEIGGGTGGITQAVLNGLQGIDRTYLFTDISPAFVQAATQRFRHVHGFQAQPLDIEKHPAKQGLASGAFDLVVAANVLHATADLSVTMAHVRELTAPGGVVLLLEVTAPQRWIDITFGLTTGWWKFTDAGLRPGYPLLSAQQWVALLEAHDFTGGVIAPDAEDGAITPSLGRESIVLARRAMTGAAQPGRAADWLILADHGGVGAQIGARIETMGVGCQVIQNSRPAGVGEAYGPARVLTTRQDFEGLLSAQQGYPSKILYLWSLDHPLRGSGKADVLETAQAIITPFLALIQALADLPADPPPQLILVTRAAQAVSALEPVDPAATMLWGLLRGVMLEHPELRCKVIDIEAEAAGDAAAAVLTECLAQDEEGQVALRPAGALVPRLAVMPPAESASATADAKEGQRLDISQRGLLENLCWKRLEPLAPGPGEVKIAVQATGLNFRDVLNALGVYAGGAVPLGSECAGVVTAVGPGVRMPQAGDRVLAIASHGFSSEVVTHALLTAPIGPAMESERAAALPIAYVTAAYALETLAGLHKGQRILIHAAAGGVGLAAVHLARLSGAEVYATAGSPEKHHYLKSLGVQQVMSSRTLDFADKIMTLTAGRGVDVVLNALAGEFIEKSLAVTARGGIFIELGRSGILSADQARARRTDVAYHAVDLTEDMATRPERIAPILGGIMSRIDSGELPLLPCRVFARAAVIDAFRFMSRARHIGKIVVAWPRSGAAVSRGLPVRSDGTYWITGGLGALGLFAAEWLAGKGAGHLLLSGRTAPTAEAEVKIAQLRAQGTRVTVMTADVGSRTAVEETVARLAADRAAPLRGILHAAGRLDDGVLRHQSWPRFASVMQAKVAGAWYLHQTTQHLPLDFFVLYSSVSALLGAQGQTNHCSANAFMDGLAHLRRCAGLRATSINWGAWAEAGAALEQAAVARAALRGVARFAPAVGLRLLERLLRAENTQAAALAVQWPQYLRQTYAGRTPPIFAQVLPLAGDALARRGGPAEAPKPEMAARLGVAPPAQRKTLLAEYLLEQTLRILGRDATESIDPDKPLNDLGLDSLMAVELRNALGQGLGRALPATLLFDYPTIGALTEFLAGELALAGASARPRAQDADVAAPNTDDLLSRIEGLRDEDIDRMINKQDGDR
jgi:acyl transferase domain-containing protein/SAM-dependent methyltransferase/acyl carrier protein